MSRCRVAAAGCALLAVALLLGLAGFLVLREDRAGDAQLPISAEEALDGAQAGGDSDEALLEALRAARAGGAEEVVQRLCREGDSACAAVRAGVLLVGAGAPRNFSAAVGELRSGADLGSPDAQFALGALYANVLAEGVDGESGFQRQEALSVLYLYAASVAGHVGAQMAMGYRYSQGYGVAKSCSAAALNYIEVARGVARVYSSGMPQAVELVRLGVEGGDTKAMSASEVSLFVEIAASGDPNIAAAVGKRYLLGIEGFRQSYKKAREHLSVAADKNHAAALGLLGYMFCLGLGVERSVDLAHALFARAAEQGDPLGHNGLGFVFFHGTPSQKQHLGQAFQHFNASAHGGSADGMFNLASLYLTATGVEQSFQKAALWYTQALDRGHTPAAYALAVMHLNGIGTMRNCKIAVDLLKRVCERGTWVARSLQEAYDLHGHGQHDAAAWLFLRLAEAGHEVAQTNLAHLLDSGSSKLLLPEESAALPMPELPGEGGEEAQRAFGRVSAQRHYELSAEQGNALSELRLGDYAYYGWGLRTSTGLPHAAEGPAEALPDQDSDGSDLLGAPLDFQLVRQEVDYALSLSRYRRTASMKITGEWMQPFVARASFNLAYMHQFGIGVAQDLALARRYYDRCADLDPKGVQSPAMLMLAALAVQSTVSGLPSGAELQQALAHDLRAHGLVLLFLALGTLLWLRHFLPTAAARRHRPPAMPPAGTPREGGEEPLVVGATPAR